MKLCRFKVDDAIRCAIYEPQRILPIDDLAAAAGEKYLADALQGGELLPLFPIDSAAWLSLTDNVADATNNAMSLRPFWLPREAVELLPPIGAPPKLLLLAGNYAAHVREQGEVAKERDETFPYVFMKPPSTTLVGDGHEVKLPAVSASHIDHEVELAIIIGRQAHRVTAQEALRHVAGYTIVNDLSDRGFHPNPDRHERPRDKFFDWLHGKWHDGFCPCGPCLVSADEIPDPQSLELRLTVDGEVRQAGSTAEQVFTVAQVIEFVSAWVTLEPGDIISTGTPAGVGNASGKFLQAGQEMVASITGIGQLTTRMIH
jgi:2,4-diketo-3-deoxy-L-fuconate hydrolase